MRVLRTIGMVAAVVLLATTAACGSKKTSIQGATGGELSNNGFPSSAIANNNLASKDDPTGDLGFYNGQPAGRHDAWIDITAAFYFPYGKNPGQITDVAAQIPCGESAGKLVVCPSGNPAFGPGPLFVFSMQFAGDVPHINPPGEQGRYSLFIDAPGGDAKSKAKASDNSPDLQNDGTNLTYQLLFGDPGGAGGPSKAQSYQLYGIDKRAAVEFFPTTARAIVFNNFVTFVVPMSERSEERRVGKEC